MVKNGTPASPATALANKVLPVPGGPANKTPFGMVAPILVNLPGSFKNSTTSVNSCFASSAPATSLNLTFTLPSPIILARLLPKFITRPPPPWVCCIMKKNTTTRMIIGIAEPNKLTHQEGCSGGAAVISTPLSVNVLINVSSDGA